MNESNITWSYLFPNSKISPTIRAERTPPNMRKIPPAKTLPNSSVGMDSISESTVEIRIDELARINPVDTIFDADESPDETLSTRIIGDSNSGIVVICPEVERKKGIDFVGVLGMHAVLIGLAQLLTNPLVTPKTTKEVTKQ
mmetsp:Transcript_29255/g.41873  ORF Transcript_29255/g.41873 Transcript_29255/m.41873 type:complete len:142 (+) Transcript_29255:213-638(+)